MYENTLIEKHWRHIFLFWMISLQLNTTQKKNDTFFFLRQSKYLKRYYDKQGKNQH